MKVDRQALQENRAYLKRLNKGVKDTIEARQKELNKIENHYDAKAHDKRLQGEVELMDVQDRNMARLREATEGKEERLEEIKKNFQETQETLEKQKSQFKRQTKDQLENMRQTQSLKAQEIYNQSREELNDMNSHINEKIKDVHSQKDRTLNQVRHKTKMAVDQANFKNQQKLAQAQSGSLSALKRAEDKFQQQVRQTEREHKDRLAEKQFENQMDLKVRERIHQDQVNFSETHFDEKVRSTKRAFEEKYQNMVEEHQKVLNRLEDQFKEALGKRTKELAAVKESASIQENDKFYRLKTIEPRVREDEKNYYIEVDTPPHEKENYILTADKRTVRLSFNRRSEKRVEGEKGVVEKSKKSEVLSKEFKVKDIVDDKNVLVSYKDGVLSYKLPKA